MTTIARVEKAAATLAAIWGVSPSEVAERLNILIDLTHLQAKSLGARALRALKSQNKQYKIEQTLTRQSKSVVEATCALLEDEVFFKKLRRELLLAARARVEDRMAAEDVVSETLMRLCYMSVATQTDALKVAKSLLRRIISHYFYWKKQDPTTVTPHEDYYILEEVSGLASDSDDEKPAESEFAPTAAPAEALRRVAAELVRQLGVKQAAVACGMREKTFSQIFA